MSSICACIRYSLYHSKPKKKIQVYPYYPQRIYRLISKSLNWDVYVDVRRFFNVNTNNVVHDRYIVHCKMNHPIFVLTQICPRPRLTGLLVNIINYYSLG